MTRSYLQLTAYDPVVARDGRPFGIGQGYRMKGLSWPYPSVVAGSLRTALVKHNGGDFTGDIPRKLLGVSVAGVFPVVDGDQLYLPAPNDCVVAPDKRPLPVEPQPCGEGGCGFPLNGLQPVMLTEQQAKEDFKPGEAPAWWPVEQLANWLTRRPIVFDGSFLTTARSQVRDHVQLDAATGAAAESLLFATTGLSLTHLPRFGVPVGVPEGRFAEQFAEITLAARVEADAWNVSTLNLLHPLGGERRLVHWQAKGKPDLWQPPPAVRASLPGAKRIRMVLATPAIFAHGWRPEWLDASTLEGTPPGSTVRLKLVGMCIQRWKAVSGWSLAEPRGPKPVKRLVPSGGVYFFETRDDPAALAEQWLQPVSDDPQDRNDGFGLAIWGTW